MAYSRPMSVVKDGDMVWSLPALWPEITDWYLWLWICLHKRLCLVGTLDNFLPLFPFLVLVSLKIVSDVTALRGLHFYNIYLPEHSTPDPERRGFSISNSTKLQWLVQMLHCTNKRFPRRVLGGPNQDRLCLWRKQQGQGTSWPRAQGRRCHKHRTQGNEQA